MPWVSVGKMKLRIDFETYSDLDLTVVGAYAYARHPSTRILMMGYRVHLGEPKLWLPGQPLPEEVERADLYYAHNAVFEYLIWLNCGEKAGLNDCPPLSCFIDVMALCGKFAYPLGLDKAAKAIGNDNYKGSGKALIKMFCGPTGYTAETHPAQWAEFCKYCMDDVVAMDEIITRLPHHILSPYDQSLWELNCKINFRGVPIDKAEAEAVYAYVTTYAEEHAKRLPVLTGGQVTKATQVARIKKWVESMHYSMPDGLGAQLIDDAFDSDNPPQGVVAEVLAIRREMGSSSAAKFKTAAELEYEGRIHMSFIKNGASTGRYASWGFQMHNLAKLCAEDPDDLFRKFMEIEEIDNPFRAAKSLVRALIKAPKGQLLCVADWAGIETHLLFWFVGDQEALDVLRNRGDLYIVMASAVYNVPIEEVCRDTQRPLGKALILGCGYGMGDKKFIFAAKSFGVTVTPRQAAIGVGKYRSRFPLVQQSWYQLTNAARKAIQNPGTMVPCLKVIFTFDGSTLWTILPSGRRLCYPEACIKDGDIQYMSTNSKTTQWCTHRLTPSQNIENIIQAMAADILEESLLRVDKSLSDHETIGHVHDEILTLIPEEQEATGLERLIDCMCVKPKWCRDLPLFAEGYVQRRFKK